MAYYTQSPAGMYQTTTPYGSPPIPGAVYPPGTSPPIPQNASTGTTPLSPYTQTAFAAAASPVPQRSPAVGYAPLTTPGVANVGVGTAQPYTAPPGQTIQPGSITYTTTTDTTGRVTYHQFKAQPATYTANGITYTGIQWVPTETTYNLPVGATPAGPEFLASWQGGQLSAEQERQMRDWQRDEDKRRKREEKETSKRVAAWEKESKARERAEDKALRVAREQDARMSREVRRMEERSGPVFPGAYDRDRDRDRERERERERDRDRDRDYDRERDREFVYGRDRDRERDRERDRAYFPSSDRDIERQFADMNVGSRSSMYGAPPPPQPAPRSRRPSMNMPVPQAVGRPSTDSYDDDHDPYVDTDRAYGDRDRHDSVPFVPPGRRSRANSTVGLNSTSPFRRSTSPLPPVAGPGGAPVYPPGHVMEGHPVSRSHSPASGYGPGPTGGSGFIPGGPVSPRMPHQRMGGGPPTDPIAVPDAFTRPINRAVTFTAFELTKIQDLEELEDGPQRMPPVLATHDVFKEEWARLMHDLVLAWTGRLPLPAGNRQPSKSELVMDLVDLWNAQFFNARGVELVVYKGRERRTGRGAGQPQFRLPRLEDSDDDTDTDDSDDDSGSGAGSAYSGRASGGSRMGPYGGGYGREDPYAESREQRRYKREEKKRRARERKQRKKEFAKKYTLYMAYVPPREFSSSGLPLH